jgi:molybdate transport system regulatory protein
MQTKRSRKASSHRAPGHAGSDQPAFSVRLRGWIEWDGQSLLGPGRLRLLDLIAETGSISAAAREMGVSYRAAWRWINEINERAGQPLVETATGGRGGGGASLTEFGERVRQAFHRFSARVDELCAELEHDFARDLED